jgi:hypothetical protein
MEKNHVKNNQIIFNDNMINNQNNLVEHNELEENTQNNSHDINISINSFQNSLSSQDKQNQNTNLMASSLQSTTNSSITSSTNSNQGQPKKEIQQQNFIPLNVSEQPKNFFQRNNSINQEGDICTKIGNNISLDKDFKPKSVNLIDVPKALNKQSNVYPIYQQMQLPSNIELTKKAIIASLNNQQTTIILQKILMESQSETIESIVEELKGEFRNIISDKNGNYFCNDLFKICDQKERIKILEELSPYLSEDCVNNFATHPIQTLVDFSSCEIEYKLILYSFNDYNKLLFASLDPNGAYVIQKIIVRIPERFRQEFNFIFTSFISFVCKQKFGIVTVKKFLSCTKNEQIIGNMMKLIRGNFMNFAIDKYGNYLIQFLLEKWANFQEGKEIKELIVQNFKVMCQQKYSSFICELFVKLISEEEKIALIKTLDLNEFKYMNNQHAIKIMKSLGIYMNNDNNIINNNFQNQMQLPLSLNNFTNNNNFPMSMNNQGFQNPNNFGNNNNFGTRFPNKYKKNNNKK